MTTLDDEISWWKKRAFKTESDAALIAFGVATGLKLAKFDYGAHDMDQIDRIRQELFALCEDTEEKCAAIAHRDLEGMAGAFARGRIHEAKGIRNAMGEIFRLAKNFRTPGG